MVEKMAANRASIALNTRTKSIKEWEKSDTSREKPFRLPEQFTIKFDKGTVFLSAVASGDLDETEKLLDEGVDIDYTNVDGLTALHQACIDENEEMVNLLLDRKANIEARDNEGWTPLHAAASAGSVEIAQILIEHGADLAAVNNEGEVPLDLAEEEEMEDFLSDEIDQQNLEVDDARNEEERLMIEDANSWINQNRIDEELDWQGATALHVAASKGYDKVISLILQIPSVDVNVRDNDGWTPLHAAVHWGSKTACELLTEAGANFDMKNSNGQTPCDLAEPEFVKTAENCRKRAKELAKKPNFTKNKRIDSNVDVNENSLQEKEHLAIANLQKKPVRPIVKGSRANYIESSKTNKNVNKITNSKPLLGRESGGSDSDSENRPTPTKNVSTASTKRPNTAPASVENTSSKNSLQNNALRTSNVINRDDKKETKITSLSGSRFGQNRFQKETEKVDPKKEEPASRVSKQPVRPSTANSIDTKAEEKKTEGRFGEGDRASRYGSLRSSRDEKENESVNFRLRSKFSDTTTTSENDTKSRVKTTTSTSDKKMSYSSQTSIQDRIKSLRKTQSPTGGSVQAQTRSLHRSRFQDSSSIFGASRSTGASDWRARLAERSKDAEHDADNARPKHHVVESQTSLKSSEESSFQKDNESSPSERISPHSRRVAHRNLRETRRSTGVVYLPENEDKDEEDGEPSEPESSKMSIAERLRKKNAEILASSDRITDRPTDRTSLSDRYTSRSSGSVTSTGRTSLTSSSSETGDTKDLQRKLDQALKEVQDYKSKYEKMKQEKEELEAKLEQYKEDIEKMQELKSDNLRLKDENGALIRVISKLSRTPAS